MALITFHDIGLQGISACVPKKISRNIDLMELIPEAELEKIIKSIGIEEKRIAENDVCASDLCYKAADYLLNEMNIDRASIDVLIFHSQSPDYKIPATAPILQHRLGLSKNTVAFDMGLACSGYIFSLSTAFAYAANPSIHRVLLLVGETFSKIVSPKDKVNAPLYGDAGTATIIEKGSFGDSFFSLNTDGSGWNVLNVPAGACRKPSSPETLLVTERENGNYRSDHHIYMDNMEVFNFTMRVVPKDIKTILDYSGYTLEDISYIVFHQANKFMTDFFVKKLKYPIEKVPYSLSKYGNVSAPTIPLTIASELRGKLNGDKTMSILCGFGAGLSWGSALLDIGKCNNFGVIEY